MWCCGRGGLSDERRAVTSSAPSAACTAQATQAFPANRLAKIFAIIFIEIIRASVTLNVDRGPGKAVDHLANLITELAWHAAFRHNESNPESENENEFSDEEGELPT